MLHMLYHAAELSGEEILESLTGDEGAMFDNLVKTVMPEEVSEFLCDDARELAVLANDDTVDDRAESMHKSKLLSSDCPGSLLLQAPDAGGKIVVRLCRTLRPYIVGTKAENGEYILPTSVKRQPN
jgi:hypothetical protein